MTRRAWTVVIVVAAVIVAATAGTALVAATHHGRAAVWPQARLSVQNDQSGVQDGQSGQGWQGGGQDGGLGQSGVGPGQDGGGLRWGTDGSGARPDAGAMGPRDRMMGRGGRQPLRGLPWLLLGLLVGAGGTVLIWQPWKRRALPAGAAGAAGAQGSAEQWVRWHRDLHAADEAATQPIPTTVADAPAEPHAAVETTVEAPAAPDSSG